MNELTSNSTAIQPVDITGVILTGGRGERMGGVDKGLIQFQGQPLIAQIIQRVQPQVKQLLINANRHLATYGTFGLPVIQDKQQGYLGPLAGIATALEYINTPYLLIVPCDAPLVSSELSLRLGHALLTQNTKLSVADDGQRKQPTFALLHQSLLADLLAYLAAGERRLLAWQLRHQPAWVDFSDQPQSFINLNTESELKQFTLASSKDSA